MNTSKLASLQPHWAHIKKQAPVYGRLMRLERPIGTLLLLWPTLWALWFSAEGIPSIKNLLIFLLGVFLMRSAGCVINDFADRKIDGKVARTKGRPLATGEATKDEALILFAVLAGCAFFLVLFTNWLTVFLSFGGLVLASAYPFMKRHTYFPQVVLGAAFSWSIVMAFAAETNTLPVKLWLIYIAVVIWTLVYDTFYAMVDRDDDIKIGVKSTAVFFGDADRVITGGLQAFVVLILLIIGQNFSMHWLYYLSVAVAAGLFGYQQYLIREREKDSCFKAFLNNNWVGLVIFLGIALDYQFL